jgi:hypothetical protein
MKKFAFILFLGLISLQTVLAQDNAEVSPILNSFNKPSTEAIWDVLFNYNLQTATGGLGNAGAVYIPTLNQFWVSRWSTPAGRIYVLNTSGVVVDSFTTSGFTGTRNMVFDPVNNEVVCGTTTNILRRVNPVTRATVGQITMPTTITARFISYDPSADGGNGGFWVGNWNAGNLHYYLVNRAGAQIGIINNTNITGTYGVAYDYWSVGGPFLWVWSQGGGAGTPQNIIQISIATGLPTGVQRNVVADIDPTNSQAIAGGLFITADLVPGKVVLGGVLQGTPDRLFGYELHVLDAGVLAPFNLTSPVAGTTITSLPNSSTPVTFTWDTSRANATYKWIFGSPTVPPRTLTFPTGTNSLNFTLGQLDNILAGLGVPQGGQITGQWDVWAFRNNFPANDSLKSANGPRSITLARGLPDLTPFNLVSPANNATLVTSPFNHNPINFTWTRSGQGVTYRVKAGPTLTNPALILPSNNNGFDTVLTITNSWLDAFLASLGVLPGQSAVGVWAAWAYSGNDSLKSVQTFNITLQRQGLGDVLVVYDSTLTNCRISRDSITAVLTRLGLTFDLFNRGGQTSTSVISFRNYDRVVWLGEGTSVMSNIQKDSIKAWLNSGLATKKRNLIIFSEDVGYQFGRTGSTNIDLDFMTNYLGAVYYLDRPATGGAQGLIGILPPHFTSADSTIGTWPDVLGIWGTFSQPLYRFRFSDTTYNAIGNKKTNFEVTTFGVDVESLRPAIDSPPNSPVQRMLQGALNYLVIPVELGSFTATANANNVILNWSTVSEKNNYGFDVQRKTNESEYHTIGFVRGNGTTTERQEYTFVDSKLPAGSYSYRLVQIDLDGTRNTTDEIFVEVTAPVEFSLSQNYPNPFNPVTKINFSLPINSKVSLKIFDVLGQQVSELLNKDLEAGYHEVSFDGSKLSSGVYIYKLEAVGINGIINSAVNKMILSK